MEQKKSDIVIGSGLLLFCIFGAWYTAKIRVPPEATVAGTSFVPWLMIGGISLFSVIMILRAILRKKVIAMIDVPNRATLARMGLFTITMTAYAAAFMTLGYIPSTLLVFVAGLLLFNERRISILIIFPLVMTGAIYLAFTRLLDVWLP